MGDVVLRSVFTSHFLALVLLNSINISNFSLFGLPQYLKSDLSQ